MKIELSESNELGPYFEVAKGMLAQPNGRWRNVLALHIAILEETTLLDNAAKETVIKSLLLVMDTTMRSNVTLTDEDYSEWFSGKLSFSGIYNRKANKADRLTEPFVTAADKIIPGVRHGKVSD